MDTLFQDIRYAARMLAKSPAFATVAVLTLALGIGANTAIFTLINSILLKMLPIQDVSNLVVVGDPGTVNSRSQGTPQLGYYSYPLYREFRDRTTVFSGIFASGNLRRVELTLAEGGNQSSPETVRGRIVTGSYFSLLGVNAILGRTINSEDDKTPGASPVAVISYRYWTRRFSQDPGVLGKTVRLNGYPFAIIGVTPAGFDGEVVGDIQDLWVPMMMQSQIMKGREWLEDSSSSWLQVMARLKPGFSIDQAKANVNLVFDQALKGSFGAKLPTDDTEALLKRHPQIDVTAGGRGLSGLRPRAEKPLIMLMIMVGLVLLIACVNVANLLLARASAREKEIAVRLAIGAAPRRVLQQMLTESVLLALLGGAVGLFVANWGSRVLLTLALGTPLDSSTPTAVERVNVQPDLHIFGFTSAICLITGVLFGLVPALRALGVQVTPTLKDTSLASGTRTVHSGWGWGKLLVAGQVTLSLLVLFAAGLMVRTLRNLQNLDLGYNPEHLLIVSVDPISAGYKPPQIAALSQQLIDAFAAIPGVHAATLSENGLFSGSESGDSIIVEGFTANNDQDKQAANDQVGPNYFSVVGVPVLLGREIGPQDTETSPHVAVINETMERFYFHGTNPIGKKIFIDTEKERTKPIEIVGVVRDVRDHELREPAQRRFYRPIFQKIDQIAAFNFEVRAAGDPSAVADSLRRTTQSIAPTVPIFSIKSVNELATRTISNEMLIAKLSSFFGSIALLLAAIGLYGLMSYAVAGRTREIGLRMALGAQRTNVLWLVLREALLLVVAGVVVGVPAAFLSSRLLNSMIFGLKSTDPISMLVVVVVLGVIAAFAGFIPARRATKIDPMVALRYE
jgi:predicted permease